MANNRRKYLRKTRRARMRDLKHSATGWIGVASSLAAIVICVIAIIWSYLKSGNGDYQVGSLGLIGLVLAVGAIFLGVMGTRQPRVRLTPPRTSIVLGVIMTAALSGLYAFGWMY